MAIDPALRDSILNSTKKLLGLDENEDSFDLDVQTHINSAFSTLFQAGVGPLGGYQIEDETDLWSAFTGNKMHISDVKSYIYLRVRMLFDPPASSFGLAAVEKQLEEFIWRLNVAADFSIVQTPTIPTDPALGEAYIWDLSGGQEFPSDAPIGATGIDYIDGEVYRNV